MRLGRLPPDPARLASAPSLATHAFGALAPTTRLDRGTIAFTPGLYQNDTLPDCTAAGLANAARAASTIAGYDIAIDPATVPAFYAACIGQPGASDTALAATDGATLLTVLAQQAAAGFAVGQQTPLVGLFGTVPIADRTALANGIAELGAGYWGVDLYQADMALPAVWDVDGSDPGAVVGGHCVIAWDYTGLADTDTVRIGTWGGWQPATWRWVSARLCEAHGLVWPQSATTSIDRTQLAAELAAWSAVA